MFPSFSLRVLIIGLSIFLSSVDSAQVLAANGPVTTYQGLFEMTFDYNCCMDPGQFAVGDRFFLQFEVDNFARNINSSNVFPNAILETNLARVTGTGWDPSVGSILDNATLETGERSSGSFDFLIFGAGTTGMQPLSRNGGTTLLPLTNVVFTTGDSTGTAVSDAGLNQTLADQLGGLFDPFRFDTIQMNLQFGSGGSTFTLQTDLVSQDIIQPVGTTPENPIMPSGGGGPDTYLFTDTTGDGAWFDPPLVGGYEYRTDGLSNFTGVSLPPATLVPDTDEMFVVTSIHGSTIVASGGSYSFPSPVEVFTVTDIDPLVDGGDPLAFPTFLSFDQSTVSFTMTPIPEPASAMLVLAFGLGITASHRRRNV